MAIDPTGLLGAVSSDARKLARGVSLATRLTPALMRSARLHFVRRAGPGVEAELWFGPLVETRGAAAATLHPGVARMLREDLARDPGDLASAKRLLDRLYARAPELVTFEAELVWNAVRTDPAARVAVDDALRRAIKSILEGGRRPGLARWAFGLRRRVPELERTPLAALLEVVAKLHLAGNAAAIEAGTLSDVSSDDRALLVSAVGMVQAGIALGRDPVTLTVRVPPDGTDDVVALAATDPALVLASGIDGDERIVVSPPASSGGSVNPAEAAHVTRFVVSLPVTLTTAIGDQYRISSLAEAASKVAFVASPSLALIEGVNEDAVSSYGVLIAPGLVVASARFLRRSSEYTVRFALRSTQRYPASAIAEPPQSEAVARVRAVTDDGLAVLRVTGALPSVEPITRAPNPADVRTVVVPRESATNDPSARTLTWAAFRVEGASVIGPELVPSRSWQGGAATLFSGAPAMAVDGLGAIGMCVPVRNAQNLRCLAWPIIDAYVDAVRRSERSVAQDEPVEPYDEAEYPQPEPDQFLLSYDASADAAAGTQVETALRDAGYRIMWPDAETRAAVTTLELAQSGAARCIVLLSAAYLQEYGAEWVDRLEEDPFDRDMHFLLVRIAECDPSTVFRGMDYVDAVAAAKDGLSLGDLVVSLVFANAEEPQKSPYLRRPPSNLSGAESVDAPRFVQDAALQQLTAILSDPPARAILVGVAGTGKSSVARRYAATHIDAYVVAWTIRGNAIEDGLADLSAYLVPGRPATDARAARAWLDRPLPRPVLLIVEDVDDPSDMERLPRFARVVATSRRRTGWPAGNLTIPVGPLTIERAAQFLAAALVQQRSAQPELTSDDLRAVADAVTTLPAAILLAARSLAASPSRSAADVVAEFRASISSSAASPRSSPLGAVLLDALADAEREGPGAAAILCLCAFYADRAIPEEILEQPPDTYPAGLFPSKERFAVPASELRAALADADRRERALSELEWAGLIDRSPADRTMSLHALASVLARRLGDDTRWSEAAAAAIEAAWAGRPTTI